MHASRSRVGVVDLFHRSVSEPISLSLSKSTPMLAGSVTYITHQRVAAVRQADPSSQDPRSISRRPPGANARRWDKKDRYRHLHLSGTSMYLGSFTKYLPSQERSHHPSSRSNRVL